MRISFKKYLITTLSMLLVFATAACERDDDPTGHTVTFETYGGTSVETLTGLQAGEEVTLEEPDKPDHLFIGWQDDEGTWFHERMTVNRNHILHARYEAVSDVFEFDIVENEHVDDDVTITQYSGDATRLRLPETIDGMLVRRIGTKAFEASAVEHLLLPKSAMVFAHSAFAGADALKTMSFYGNYAGYAYRNLPSQLTYDILDSYEDVCVVVDEGSEPYEKVYADGCPIHKMLAKTDEIIGPGGDVYYGYEVIIDFAHYDTPMPFSWSTGVFANSTLKRIEVPSRLKHLNMMAFIDAEHLEAVEVKEGNAWFTSVEGILYDDAMEILYVYPPAREHEAYTLPASVETVHQEAFAIVPNPSLQRILVEEDHPHFTAKDGVLYDFDQQTLHVYPPGKTDASFDVPASVNTLDFYAFAHTTHLRDIRLNDGLETIRLRAFYGSGIEALTVVATVSEVGTQAFYDAERLETVVFERNLIEDPWSLGGTLFAQNHPDLTVYVPDESRDAYLAETHLQSLDPSRIRPVSELQD